MYVFSTGTPPLTRFFGQRKTVSSRRIFLLLKPEHGTFSFSKPLFEQFHFNVDYKNLGIGVQSCIPFKYEIKASWYLNLKYQKLI